MMTIPTFHLILRPLTASALAHTLAHSSQGRLHYIGGGTDEEKERRWIGSNEGVCSLALSSFHRFFIVLSLSLLFPLLCAPSIHPRKDCLFPSELAHITLYSLFSPSLPFSALSLSVCLVSTYSHCVLIPSHFIQPSLGINREGLSHAHYRHTLSPSCSLSLTLSLSKHYHPPCVSHSPSRASSSHAPLLLQ